MTLALADVLSHAARGADGEVIRLGHWTFDEPARAPLVSGARESGARGGGRSVKGALGDALEFRDGDAPAVLPLAGARADAVSVRFRYQPSWTTMGRDAGMGPRHWARLLSAGAASGDGSGPLWELSIDPTGHQFELALGQQGGGRRNTARSVPVVFDAGRWSELVLTVIGGRARLDFDSRPVLSMDTGTFPGGAAVVFREGVAVGARRDGIGSALGAVDDMEWRATPMGRVEALKLGRLLSVEETSDGAALELSWRLHGGARLEWQRAPAGSGAWSNLARVDGRAAFRDTGVEPGRPYDYRLLTNGMDARLTARAGLRLPPLEHPGAVAVIVDESLERALGDELGRLDQDLRAEGWEVLRRAAPRHNDRTWSANTNAIAELRAWVGEQWRARDGGLRALYLIGHVVVPYAGMLAEDLHAGRGDNHYGAWPADQYYADVDGVWTDDAEMPGYLSVPTHRITRNDPRDGKWDTAWVAPNPSGNTRLEMAFARVDFAGMPVLGRGRDAEVAALRRYLGKAHRYRDAEMPAERRAVFGVHFDNGAEYEIATSVYRTAGRVFGAAEEGLAEQDVFSLVNRSATWGFSCGPGRIDQMGRSGGLPTVTASALASGAIQPRAPFVMLLGSWFGDWAAGENNLLRAVLASKDHAVAVFWVRKTEWRFDAMARGGTLADAQLETANEGVRALDPNHGTTRTLTILGDPTLRLYPLPRPRQVRGERRGREVSLQWKSADGVLVYRSDDGRAGAFHRLTPDPVSTGRWIDAASPSASRYLVRAVRLEKTGSGSYTNLSPGASWPASR